MSRLDRSRALMLAVLTVSCSRAVPAEVEAPSRVSQAPSAAVPALPPSSLPSPKERALQDRLQSALAYVSQIRSLPAKSPVKGSLISRSQIEQFISGELDEETPPDVLEATSAVLYGLGTVDASFDYRSTIISLMTSQLLGFYDPKRKTFFVSGDLSGDEADVTLWHELVHALQDQNYDLSHLSEFQPDAGDRQAAVHALAEGDATSTMLDAMLKPRGTTALDVPEGLLQAQTVLGSAVMTAPPVLVRSLLAPYVDGLAFTNYLRRHGGFAALDGAWRAPPQSTEQLLHPEKYLAGEQPLTVPIPSAPPHASQLKERFHDVMGEQTIRLLLEEWLPGRTAASAAAGWGGDRLAAFADDARQTWAIGWHLRFDSPAAADRAFLAFSRAAPLTERGSNARLAPAPSSMNGLADKLCQARRNQGPLALQRRGPDLAVAVGPFSRNGVAVSADPDCGAALAWVAAMLTD